MVTGSDHQKASVGFKAFGLRTEASCMDLLDSCVLWVCVCVGACVSVGFECVSGCV